MADISITVSDEACAKEITDAALAALRKQTESSIGALTVEGKPLSVLAYVEDRLVGGVLGKVFYQWLYIDLVWVEEELRGQGIGTKLMKAAEQRARERKLIGIYLWTESWQAPGFYPKFGYQQFVEFENCPPGHSRLGFRKSLA